MMRYSIRPLNEDQYTFHADPEGQWVKYEDVLHPCGTPLDAHFAQLKAEIAITRPEATSASKLPSLPDEIQEWCWHMDLHVTEHDERHAAMALRSAWPHVSKWLQENVGPSSKAGVPFAQSPQASTELFKDAKYGAVLNEDGSITPARPVSTQHGER